MEKEHLIFSFKIQWVILSGQDSAILSTQVAKNTAQDLFHLSCSWSYHIIIQVLMARRIHPIKFDSYSRAIQIIASHILTDIVFMSPSKKVLS